MQRTETERRVGEFLESNGFDVSDTAPRAVLSAINMLFDKMISQTEKSVEEIAPEDFVEVINNNPNFNFLKQIIPSILED